SLQYADLPEEVTYPLVRLDHQIVQSYISHVHATQARHSRAATTEFYFKQMIPSPNAARLVQDQVRDCLPCRRYWNVTPFNVPMAPLPQDWVSRGYVFQAVVQDLFGPLQSNRSQMIKHYGLIFTCVKSRAVHLELVESRATTAMMRATVTLTVGYGSTVQWLFSVEV